MKTSLLVIVSSIFLLISTGNISANECEIGQPQITVNDCDSVGSFTVELDFEYANTGNEGFHVQGNGNSYGNFEYGDLPITIGPLDGDGETEYEFVIIDNQYEGCSNWNAIDPVDCDGGSEECFISELIIDDYPCEAGNYNVLLDFEYENVSEEGFKLYVNNDLFDEYGYDELPLNIGPFEGDGETIYHFLVEDFTELCASDANFGPIECDNEGCQIWNVEADVLPCNESGFFNVAITFNYQNVGTEGYRIQGNGNDYGTYEYDSLPVFVGPLEGDGETVYEFVVIDNQSDECSDWTEIDPVDCEGNGDECYLSELTIDDHPCEDGLYNVYLDFEYENVSEAGFKLLVDWEVYDTYQYEDLPLNIGPFEGDGETVYHFLVKDLEIEGCASDANFGPIFCDSTGNCNIWDVEADVLPCDESGFFNVKINLEYVNTGNEGFRIQGNGNDYGDFEYSDLPVTIGPLEGDGETEYEFVVIDNQFEECSDWTAIEPVDCDGNDCNIWDMVVEAYPCEEGQFFVDLDFEYEHVSESGFKLFVNWDLYASYEYDDLPITIGPFEGDGETSYHFLVRDKIYEDCAEDLAIDPINCNEAECSIWDVVAVTLPCNEENEFDVLLNFEYVNEGNEGFELKGNGNNYGTFEYTDLPITLGPFIADGETEYEFEARDNQYDDCYNWTSIDPFECDTSAQMINMNMEIEACEENSYYLQINFDMLDDSYETFTVFGNGMEGQTFNYDDLPVQIGPLTNDEVSSYYFIIMNNGVVNFGNWHQFYPFTCESLGLVEQSSLKNEISIYPNPSDRRVQFKNNGEKMVDVAVFDMTGKIISQFKLETHSIKHYDFNQAGLYFYRMSDGDSVISGKITIW